MLLWELAQDLLNIPTQSRLLLSNASFARQPWHHEVISRQMPCLQELSPSCLQPGTTDDDSYVRTEDEEEAANTDWEETVHRWVNR